MARTAILQAMLEVSVHDDVTRLRCSTRASRALGLDVSAYVARGVLVDTAFPDVGHELEDWLATARLEGALVTHYHEDHAGNVGRLVARGLPVGMAPETLARIRAPRPIGMYRRICWGSAAALPRDPEPFAHEGLQPVPAPGHTTDHQVVWDAARETVFGGDLFLGVKVRIAHPGEDIRGQAAVLRRIAALRPRRFFDAHRGPVEHPVDALLAKAQWIDELVGAVERRADEGRDSGTIARETLGAGDLTGWFSRSDYSKRNVIESILATRGAGPPAGGAPTLGDRAQ
jgi:glyoxylase-like metal-dependent hydrolase (beta-lactamase superfamily II)